MNELERDINKIQNLIGLLEVKTDLADKHFVSKYITIAQNALNQAYVEAGD